MDHKQQHDDFVEAGQVGQGKRMLRGLATAKYRDVLYCCFKGRKAPRLIKLHRCVVDVGSHTAADVMESVPVVRAKDLPRIDPALKLAVHVDKRRMTPPARKM